MNQLILEHDALRRPEVSVFGPTVGEYLEEWLTRARVSVRASTWAAIAMRWCICSTIS